MRIRVFLCYLALPLGLLLLPALGSAQQSIRCESNNGSRVYCGPGNINPDQVTMQRQISGSPCDRGSTWGVDRRGLWVDRGCRADFVIGYRGPGPGGPGGGWWDAEPGAPWPPRGDWHGGNWGRGGACFYSDRNFGGKYLCLRRGERRDQLGDLGDDISSIRVFGGARVIVYNDRNFQGPSAATARDVPDLRAWSYGGGHTWNNRISSVRVR